MVNRILGRSGGTSFYKKFLLVKSTTRTMALTTVPINLPDGQHYEESEVSETFINFRTHEGKILEASIEKKGANLAFAYTLKMTIEKNKTQIHKKRSISASEYIDLKTNKIKGMHELNCQRICTVEGELYFIIDYYPQVEGQPMICIMQVDQNKMQSENRRIQTPDYLQIEKEITDMAEYTPAALAKRVMIEKSTASLLAATTSVDQVESKSGSGDER